MLGTPPVFAQDAAACAEGETQVITDGVASCVPTVEGDAGVAVDGEAGADAPTDETAETPAEEAPADGVADAPVEEAPAEEMTETPAEEAPTEDVVETPAEDVPADDVAETPAEEAPAEAAPTEDVVETPSEEAPAEDAAETPAEEAPTEETAETPAEEAPAEGVAETPAEEAPTEEVVETPAEEAPAEEVVETPAEEAPAEEVVETPAEEATAEGDTETAEAEPEVVQDDTADTTAAANAQVETEAAAAPVTTEAGEGAEVETVTEESARSSDEEFSRAEAVTEDDDGLSKLEKFALGALGVAAVATILNQDDDVVVASDDRVVLQDGQGGYRVLKNDDELLRRPGARVTTEQFDDGSTRTIVNREDGSRVVTIRSASGQTLMRTRILPDGREVMLFDDTQTVQPVDVATLPTTEVRPALRASDNGELRAALAALENPTDRTYSLQQVRQIRAVRNLVPEIDVEAVNFESGSAVIQPEEARDLAEIGQLIADEIAVDPGAVFLIEGHTDAVGGAAMNLALSDRRAESTALALTEYFAIPPENLVVQGYGEANLKVRTNAAERINRRVAVRKITPLLRGQ
ncbi:OmpA family protein [Tateyamaria omphalii]|nr:OmpA family protein [Tateyamaria omphalii]